MPFNALVFPVNRYLPCCADDAAKAETTAVWRLLNQL